MILFTSGNAFSVKWLMNMHPLKKKKRVKGFKSPWVNNELTSLRNARDYHHKKAIKTNLSSHWNRYKKLRNQVTRYEKKLKSNYYCNLINDSMSNSEEMWKSLKQVLPGSKDSKQITSISISGKVYKKCEEIAEALNKHFSTIGEKLARRFGSVLCESDDFPLKTGLSFSLQPVTVPIVLEQLKCLKPNKAIGLDRISSRLLKDGTEVVAPLLTYIINLSLSSGRFPENWKLAKITALYKNSGKMDNCDNYRPISILLTVSKIVERAVHSQLYEYLTTNTLLYIKQYGFRRKRSTASALLKFTDEILNNMVQGEVTGAVFLDLKKAFDTVNHRILLLKLQSLGVDVLSIPWFKSYLENRGFQTSVGNSISSKKTMNIGVPQGSVLGPLLFLVYVNDLADVLKNCQASLFADDTAIYCSSQTAIDLEAKLNEDLNHVKDWLNKHRLTLNIKKSKLMLIGGQKRLKLLGQVNLNIDDENIEQTGHYKYLGVVINENPTWSDHVDLICSKVSKRLGMIKRIKHLLPKKSREIIFNTIVLPLFDYADVVWGDMNRLQIFQNKAAKLITDKPPFSS